MGEVRSCASGRVRRAIANLNQHFQVVDGGDIDQPLGRRRSRQLPLGLRRCITRQIVVQQALDLAIPACQSAACQGACPDAVSQHPVCVLALPTFQGGRAVGAMGGDKLVDESCRLSTRKPLGRRMVSVESLPIDQRFPEGVLTNG